MTILSVELLALCIAAFPRGELPGILLNAMAHVGGGIVLLLPIATRIWRLRHGRLGLDNLRSAKAYGGLMGMVSGVAGSPPPIPSSFATER